MNARLFATALLVAIASGCTCATAGGGSDGGGSIDGAQRVAGVTPGAPYAFGQRLAPGVELASSESRLYVVQADGGGSVIDRPEGYAALGLNSISRDRKYLYSTTYWQGIWRISDGAKVVSSEGFSGWVIGETAAGALVTVSEGYDAKPELSLVPLDGSTKRLIGESNASSATLFEDDVVIFFNAQGLWRADLKVTAAPTRLDMRPVQALTRVEGTAYASVRLNSGDSYWLDLTAPFGPVLTDLTAAQFGFVSAQGTASFVRLDGAALKIKASAAGTETVLYTSKGAINFLNVTPGSGLIVFRETVSGTTRAYVAELKSPFEPINVPDKAFLATRPLLGSRHGYVWFPYPLRGVLEVDFAARTAFPVIETGTALAMRGESLVYRDEGSENLRVKRFGVVSTEASTQRCWLLRGTTELMLHQCVDRALYRLDSSDRSVRVAGIEVAESPYGPYDFAASGDLVRYYDAFSVDSFAGGSAWLYQVSTKKLLLSETENHFYTYRFAAGKYVRAIGEGETGAVSVFDPASGSETGLSFDSRFTVYPIRDHRDGGAHLVFEDTTDAGNFLRLYDIAAGTFVPVADAGAYWYGGGAYLDRFVAEVVDRDDNVVHLLEGATGLVVSLPMISDGGTESPFRDVVSATGKTRYLGWKAVYDENLRPLIEVDGFKVGTVDRAAGALYVLSGAGSTPTSLITVYDDNRPPQLKPLAFTNEVLDVSAQEESGVFVVATATTDGGTTLTTFTPATDTWVQRKEGKIDSFEVYRGGFFTFAHAADGISLIAFPDSDAMAHTLTQPPERVLRYALNAASNRLVIRSTSGTWREATLSVVDLTTLSRQVVFRTDASTKLGAFTLSGDGTQLLFTTSAWDGSTSSLWVKSL